MDGSTGGEGMTAGSVLGASFTSLTVGVVVVDGARLVEGDEEEESLVSDGNGSDGSSHNTLQTSSRGL